MMGLRHLRKEVGINFEHQTSRTQQQFADSANINEIMRKFETTGMIEWTSGGNVTYGDFSTASDFHDQMVKVRNAEEAFAQLPAKIRARMDNDPVKFLEFLQDDENREEAEQLGLVEPVEKTQETAPVETTTEDSGQ